MFDIEKFPNDFFHYILLKKIQSHHNFDLYLALAKDTTNRLVMIKVPKQIFQKHEDFAKIFKNEIKINSLLNHPNITTINSFQEDGMYIELEYLFGKSFKDLFNKYRDINQEIPSNVLIYVFKKICRGLDYLHQGFDLKSGKPLNLVHEEVNPHNLFITYDGEVKVLDFGLSKSLTMIEHTTLGHRKESLFYKAPEYFNPVQQPDLRSDVYALGIILWEMLTQKKLFTGSTLTEVMEKIKNPKVVAPSKLNPNIDSAWDSICLRALDVDPSKRFQSMKEFYQALHGLEDTNKDDYDASEEASSWLKKSFYSEFEGERSEINNLVGNVERKYKLKSEKKNIPSPLELKARSDLTRVAIGMFFVMVFVFFTFLTYSFISPQSEKNPYFYITMVEARNPASILSCNFEIVHEPDMNKLQQIGKFELSSKDIQTALKDEIIFKNSIFTQVCKVSGKVVVPQMDADGYIVGGNVFRYIN